MEARAQPTGPTAHAVGGRAARLGAHAVSVVLTARGVVGLARPDLLPAGTRAPFPRLNAVLYSPLCLVGGAAVAASARRPRA